MLTLRTVARVMKVNRKSKSPGFENLQVGDILEFSIQVCRVGSNRGRTYSPYIKILNTRTEKFSELSFNQIESVLSCCELKDVSAVDLVEKYARKHELANSCGSEYIYQSEEAQADAIELVGAIFDQFSEE